MHRTETKPMGVVSNPSISLICEPIYILYSAPPLMPCKVHMATGSLNTTHIYK